MKLLTLVLNLFGVTVVFGQGWTVDDWDRSYTYSNLLVAAVDVYEDNSLYYVVYGQIDGGGYQGFVPGPAGSAFTYDPFVADAFLNFNLTFTTPDTLYSLVWDGDAGEYRYSPSAVGTLSGGGGVYEFDFTPPAVDPAQSYDTVARAQLVETIAYYWLFAGLCLGVFFAGRWLYVMRFGVKSSVGRV